MGERSDLQLIERAVKRRWSFDKTLAERAVEDGLQSPDDRVRVRALAIAVAMEKQNQSDEHKVIDVDSQHRRDRIVALAARLGVDPVLIGSIGSNASGDTESVGESSRSDET